MKVKVNGDYFLYFNDFSMSSNLDSVASTFAFLGRYDPTVPQHKVLFGPLNYPLVQFYDNEDNLFFTGTVTTPKFNSDAAPKLCSISGYSLGGVLEDCTIPYEAYPLESANRSLKEITQRLLSFFKLTLVVDKSVTKDCDIVYAKSVASPTASVKDYLAKMAAQRNVILSHDVNGNILLFRPDTNAPAKAFFDKTNIVGDMELNVEGQHIHSELTSVRQPGKRNIAEDTSLNATETLKNSLVKAYRPFVHILSSGSETDVDSGVKNAFAAELKHITVSFKIDHWEKLNPGDIIEVQNDEIFIANRARMMIYNTIRNESAAEKSMVISCVMPETFSGVQPVNIFS